jgi:hypothetical protein
MSPGGVLIGAFLRRWACAHIDEHAAEIRAALLAALGGIPPEPRLTSGRSLEGRRINRSLGGRGV